MTITELWNILMSYLSYHNPSLTKQKARDKDERKADEEVSEKAAIQTPVR